VILGWLAARLNLKARMMVFRFTTSQAESIASEVQQCLAALSIQMQHFRISMAGAMSIVEFEADVSHRQQETILTRLNRPGIVSEVVPITGHHE
jgi:hypothetical protein